MHIGINILYLIPGKVGGTETYARELIPRLAQKNKITIFCGRDTATTFSQSENIRVVALPFNSSNRILRIVFEQLLLPFYSAIHQVDILFSLGYSAPFFHSMPSVVTIHDLNYHYHPEDFSRFNLLMWRFLTWISAISANHVITDSLASGVSIHSVLGIKENKITPILHATPTPVAFIPKISNRPYLFTVVANYPHKNLVTLLKVFKLIEDDYPQLDLVVCGLGKQPASNKRIKYLGYVSRSELAALYSGATVFVFPSSYEGFGYPVLEAMSYGAPVVSSNAYSLKEVVGEGGILVDPYDVSSYVTAIKSIIDSEKFRQSLVKTGYKRSLELEWSKTAQETIKVLKKL